MPVLSVFNGKDFCCLLGMAGIYIHIPFCKSRCRYCDFYSTTMLGKREEYVRAVIDEAELRRHYLGGETVSTIYFGGGTPSLILAEDIRLILNRLRELFKVTGEAEITTEGNPGDLTKDYLCELHEAGVNRLSIGIQSFSDDKLRLLGRRHTGEEARRSVTRAREVGFNNISIDLIYGIPGESLQDWQEELRQAISLNIEHISTYCLTYEEGTRMTDMLKRGEICAVDDETENEMYAILVKTLSDSGFYRYEVSNFAKPHQHSHHNSAYWNGTKYLGLGAAAHSFDGKSRQWNKSDIDAYMREVEARNLQPEKEDLTDTDLYNERVMLGLRTAGGIDLGQLSAEEKKHCLHEANRFLTTGHLIIDRNRLTCTDKGINILNLITEYLMQ